MVTVGLRNAVWGPERPPRLSFDTIGMESLDSWTRRSAGRAFSDAIFRSSIHNSIPPVVGGLFPDADAAITVPRSGTVRLVRVPRGSDANNASNPGFCYASISRSRDVVRLSPASSSAGRYFSRGSRGGGWRAVKLAGRFRFGRRNLRQF